MNTTETKPVCNYSCRCGEQMGIGSSSAVYAEMLEALEAMLEAYAPNADWSKPEQLHGAVRKAGAAIAKAKRGGAWPYATRSAYLRLWQQKAAVESDLARVRGLLQRQWISVEERLPEFQMKSIVFLDGAWKGCGWRAELQDGWVWLIENTDGIETFTPRHVSHWQPMPEPPTFPQSSSLVPQGAESADIGKLDAADKSGKVNRMEQWVKCIGCEGTGRMVTEHVQDDGIGCYLCNGNGYVLENGESKQGG